VGSDVKKPNFVDAHYDYRNEQVVVWEKGDDRKLRVKRYSAPFYFYYDDPDGEHTSIYGDKLSRYDAANKRDFDAALKRYARTFESDISPLDKVLQNNYYGIEAPALNYSLLDIEVDYDKKIGFSSPANPYAPVNAITIFNQWENSYYTVAIPPKDWIARGWVGAEGLNHIDDDLSARTTMLLVRTERELLEATLDILEDSDCVSGWNSENFDLPYLLKRCEIVLGKRTNAWSRPEGRPPYFKDVTNDFGKTEIRAVISGRQHLDYLELFKKFTFGSRESYSLANIAIEEVPHIPKLEYEGSLDGLYVNDFNWFIRYNIRDVEVLEALDLKFKFIALANELAHVNTVVLPKVLGSVHPIDSGIINHVHYGRKHIVPDKSDKKGGKIKGAMVLIPKVGMHPWMAAVDINSLYPSVYRTLNISPEMVVGQFDGCEDAWLAIRDGTDEVLTLRLDSTFSGADGEFIEATGEQWREHLVSLRWAVSAYGTVFDQSRGDGFIPELLANWYAERKRLKKLMAQSRKEAVECGVVIPEALRDLL
jgi:DNA polymerase elongation subunit (family B)